MDGEGGSVILPEPSHAVQLQDGKRISWLQSWAAPCMPYRCGSTPLHCACDGCIDYRHSVTEDMGCSEDRDDTIMITGPRGQRWARARIAWLLYRDSNRFKRLNSTALAGANALWCYSSNCERDHRWFPLEVIIVVKGRLETIVAHGCFRQPYIIALISTLVVWVSNAHGMRRGTDVMLKKQPSPSGKQLVGELVLYNDAFASQVTVGTSSPI